MLACGMSQLNQNGCIFKQLEVDCCQDQQNSCNLAATKVDLILLQDDPTVWGYPGLLTAATVTQLPCH